MTPIQTLKSLRANASPPDRYDPALAFPQLPEYRHGGDRNRPAMGIANDPGTLAAWCEAEGLDPAAALGLATWHAVRLWYRSTPHTAARSALTSLVGNCVKRLKGEPTREFSAHAFHAVNRASALWQIAGRPLLDLACADAQRTMIGLRNVARRGGQ